MNPPQRRSPDASRAEVSDAAHFVHARSPEEDIGRAVLDLGSAISWGPFHTGVIFAIIAWTYIYFR